MTDYKAGQRAFDRWLRDVYGLTLSVRDNGLQTDDDGWQHFAWTMTVRKGRNGAPYEFPYRAGMAHKGKPTLVDIVAALFADARCVAYAWSFEEFCGELGYDTDSRKAEIIYRQIQVHNAQLVRLFDVDSLTALLRLAEPYVEAAGL